MGIFHETVDVIWDTSSDWLFVQSYLCSTCTNDNVYNYADEEVLVTS